MIVQARKPDFFNYNMSLYEVVTDDGLMRPVMKARKVRRHLSQALFSVNWEDVVALLIQPALRNRSVSLHDHCTSQSPRYPSSPMAPHLSKDDLNDQLGRLTSKDGSSPV